MEGEMPTGETFSRQLIEEFLNGAGLNDLTNREGTLKWESPRYVVSERRLTLHLNTAARDHQSLFRIRIQADLSILQKDWGRALMTCNTWNRKTLWPTAFFWVENLDQDETGEIVLKRAMGFAPGAPQKLLSSFIVSTFAAGVAFWKWAHQEQGF
jgi:hypothetical protein